MSLSTKPVARTPLHKRAITLEVFERDDGLWDIEAQLVDTKAYNFYLTEGGEHPAGKPIHDILLCITIDDSYTIVDANASYQAAPYSSCNSIQQSYKLLVGLNLLKKFRYEVRARFAGKSGCTHLTELTSVLPTAAIQGIATRSSKNKSTDTPATRPFHIDGCHALRADGEVVRVYYPKWYENPEAAS